MNLANFFTCLRVLLIPVFMLVYYSHFRGHHVLSAAIFIVACITDWLDGHTARRLKQTSRFGAFLDPVADKLLVAITLVLLAANYTSPWYVVSAALIVAREVLVSALREWMAEQQQRDAVAVGWIGKWKTTVQMIALGLLLTTDPDGPEWLWLPGFVLINVAAALALWSMLVYLQRAWPQLKNGMK
ncbi:MAG TPA: CDP-diacylglycerol--glycerol-3-phosphate 3-phosphatidyltransferase [Candidatus Acidoferrum sp.]|nr:CDP-diacylglycerol--glycerol-3-phosphate 3-phosphatidyltransferase [Candidatus Acidoferrum sp.]